MSNSFTLYDYEQARSAYRQWHAKQYNNEEEYIVRQRKAELNKLVRKVIENELNDTDKKIAILYWYKNMPQNKISSIVGMSSSTINRRINKICDTLFDKLKYVMEFRYGVRSNAAAPVLIKEAIKPDAIRYFNSAGSRVRYLREKNYFTLSDISDMTGIPAKRLERIEKRGSEMTLNELSRLSAFFKVSPTAILGGEKVAKQNKN